MDGYESKAAALILQERLTSEAGEITVIDFDQSPFEVVMAISRHLRYKDRYRTTSWDKMVSKFGAIPVALSRVRLIVAEQGLGPYYVARRRNRSGQGIEYGVYEDLGNYTYSMWLATRATESRIPRMIAEYGKTMDMWGDQVEAALGICFLGERVSLLRQHFRGNVEAFRRKFETELAIVKGALPPELARKSRKGGKNSYTPQHLQKVREVENEPDYVYSDEEDHPPRAVHRPHHPGG